MKFYLRQTVQFNISDVPKLILLFLKRRSHSLQTVEAGLARYLGAEQVILSNSMRTGIQLCLQYYRKEKPSRNEILIPEYGFHSNLSAAINAGFKIKYIRVNPNTLEIEAKTLKQAITSSTLGVILTHIHGRSNDLERIVPIIKEKKLILFEDCAHAIGQVYKKKQLGTYGVGCYSFGAGKNITSLGGGAIATDDLKLSKYLREKQHGYENLRSDLAILVSLIAYTLISNPFVAFVVMKPLTRFMQIAKIQRKDHDVFSIQKSEIKRLGTPSCFQLALLHHQFTDKIERLNSIIATRRTTARRYDQLLENKHNNADSTFCFQYPIRVKNTDDVISKLWKKNIDAQIDYCSYLPLLYSADKIITSIPVGQNIVYLPTNRFLDQTRIVDFMPVLKESLL